MTSIRIETATNSGLVRAAAGPRATIANVLHLSEQNPSFQLGVTNEHRSYHRRLGTVSGSAGRFGKGVREAFDLGV